MRFLSLSFVCILIICCVCLTVFSARNKQVQDETESQESRQSLLDIGHDDDLDNKKTKVNPTEETKSYSSNKTNPVTKKHKPKSRRIRLPDDYSKLEIPRKPNARQLIENALAEDTEVKDDDDFESLEIRIDVKVRNIREINEIEEEITAELDFTAKWLDVVILFGNKDYDPFDVLASENFTAEMRSLDQTFLAQIWKPDIFIENVVSITRPELMAKPTRLLYSPTGYISFSTRVTIKMDCEMEFHYYPADTQLCKFKFRSYSYTTKDLNIIWDTAGGGPFLLDESDHSFDIKLDMLNSYELVEREGLIDDNYDEVYKILQFQISARRKLSFQLIQTYLPSTFFIIITWLSFLVPATMMEARIGISMTTLLTLTSMFASVRENSPVVSYVKAIDIWMVACVFFVFLTLFEFALLTWRRHLNSTGGENSSSEVILRNRIKKYSFDTLDLTDKSDAVAVRNRRQSVVGSRIDNYLLGYREEDIEQYGFRAFALLFLLFNLVYWPWLLLASEYFVWNVDPTYNVVHA